MEAIAEYQKAIELSVDASAYNGWGNALAALGDFEGAIDKFRSAVTINPHYQSPYANWGNALINQGKIHEGNGEFERAVGANPGQSDIFRLWGDALGGAGRHADAIAKYQQAIELNPSLTDAYNGWGDVLVARGRTDEAISKYRKTVEINPLLVNAYLRWGQALISIGRTTDAITVYKSASQKNPQSPLPYLSLADVLFDQKAYRDGVEAFDHALARDSTKYSSHIRRGNAWVRAGNQRLAIEQYRVANDIDPTAGGYVSLGDALEDRGAIINYRKALQINPHAYIIHPRIGAALFEEFPENGAEEFEQAISMNPGDSDVYNAWGDALVRAYRLPEAIAKYKIALDM
jgi:tetratricopeptide (TPR) repeat protein